MSVPFSIRCPKCKTKLTIKKKELIGKQAPCPKCKTKLVIQPPAPQPAAPAADELPDVGLTAPVEAAVPGKMEAKQAVVKPTKMPVKAATAKKTAKPQKPKAKPAPADDDDDFLDEFDEPEDSFDDFDDDFEDDDDFDDEPTPTKKSKGKPGGKSKKPAAKKTGKSGSKTPIIIVASVLGLALAGGATWFLWPDGGDDDQTIADAGNSGNDATGEDTATNKAVNDQTSNAKANPTTDANAGDAEKTGDGTTLAANNGSATTPSTSGFDANNFASQPANTTGASTPTAPATFDVSYLPVDSEVFVRIDVESVYNAPPIQMLLNNPAIKQNIDKVQDEIGVGIADVKSVTIGVPDVMKLAEQVGPMMMMGMGGPGGMRPGGPGMRPGMQNGGPPNGFPGGGFPGGGPPPNAAGGFPDPRAATPPGANGAMPPGGFPPGGAGSPPEDPGVIVIRLKKAIEAAQIQKVDPTFKDSSHAGTSYLRKDGPKPAGLWQPDPMTIVTGVEDNVKKVMDQGSALPSANLSFVNPNANILIAFVPKQPDAIFRANPAAAAQAPPPVKPVAENLINQTDAVSIGIDLNTDLGLVASILCKTPEGADQMQQDMQQLLPMAKGALQQQMQNAPAMQIGYMKMGENLLNSLQFSHTDRHFQLAGKSAKAGTALATQASMMIPMMLPAITQARGAARRTQSKNNLKQISLAMMNSHTVYQRYPDLASNHEDTGKPLLSWRVHMLPFVEQKALYEQFHLDEPWDSPHNKTLIDQMPAVYKSPSAELESGLTTYLAATGPGTVFEDGKGRSLRDISDGTSNTILVVEVDEEAAVTWTQPSDFTLNQSDVWTGIGATYEDGFQAAFCDGHVGFVSIDTAEAFVKAMFTRGAADNIE